MANKKQRSTRKPFITSVLAFLVPLLFIVSNLLLSPPQPVQAATSSNLNFQARLLNASGGLVPDGTYNIEFKLYDTLAAGASAQGVCVGGATDDCLWVETRTGANKVTVKNGYFSVNLASITGFPALNWDQDMWLTMNIGGTAGPTWDGEMSPRIKLTAVPHAFNSSQLDGIDSTGFAQLAPASVQGVNSASNAIRINQTGAGNLLQLQGSGLDVLTLDKTGILTLGTSNGASGNTGKIVLANSANNNTVTIQSGSTTTTYALTLPLTVGSANECLKNSGTAGTLTFASCGAAGGTLQDAYDTTADATPEIVLTSAQGVLTIQDASSALGTNLLEVTSNGGGTKYFAVTASGIQVTGSGTFSTSATIGTTSVLGDLILHDGNGQTTTFRAGDSASSQTFVFPTTLGSASQCVKNSGTAGILTFANCNNGSGSGGAVTLQDAYDADGDSTEAIIVLNSTDGSLLVRDASTPLTTAFAIQNNAGSGNLLSVASTGVNIGVDTTIAAQKTLRLIGGTTAQRPGSPTEGQIYFDTDTDQLLVYGGGAWQNMSRSSTKVVAASNSQTPAGADYQVTSAEETAGNADSKIQAAIAALPAQGGTVYLMEGTYTIDTAISVPSNVTLAGAGASTIIKLEDGINASISAIVNSDTTNGNTNIKLRDFKLDGNKANNTAGTQHAIVFIEVATNATTAGADIRGLTIDNFRTDAIGLLSSYNVKVYENTIQNSNQGIVSDSSSGLIISNNILVANSVNVYFGGVSQSTISNNIVSNSVARGITLINSSNNIISANNVNGSGTDGIGLNNSNNNIVSANKLHNNTVATGNSSIYMTNSDANSINSNEVTDTAGSGHAINIADSTSDNNYLADNRFSGTGATTIQDLGTGTVYANQSRGANGAQLTTRTANATDAFQIQKANGDVLFNIDSTNNEIEIGKASSIAGSLVVHGSTSGNVTLKAGATITSYDLTLPTAIGATGECLKLGTVAGTSGPLTFGSCGAAGGTLQGAYTASTGSTTPEIVLDTTRNGVDIQDADTTIGATTNLFGVRASATASTLGTLLFGVQGGGFITMQPAASLTNGQIHVTQNVTAANATASGVVRANQLNLTVSNSTAGTTYGHDITVTDNTSSIANTNVGLKITMAGSNTNQEQIGLQVSANKGTGIKVTSSGSGNNTSCGTSGNVQFGICSYATGSSAAGIWSETNGNGSSLGVGVGTGVLGYNSAGGSAGNFYHGLVGQTYQNTPAAYTSIGVYGTTGAGTGATMYGGYFSLVSSSTATLGSALYASNSTVAANILQLQDNTTDVFRVADGGLLTMAPAASLTNGQIHVTQNVTAANATASGVVRANQLNLTVSNSTAGETYGHDITVTDNTSSIANTNIGLKVTMAGSNATQAQYGIDVSVNKGIGIKSVSNGTGSTPCGQNGNLSYGVCGESSAGAGILGYSSASGGSIISNNAVGAGLVGANGATATAGNVYYGVKGITQTTDNAGYTSIGIYGEGRTGTSGTAYGGYFAFNSSSGNTLGSALYASNSTVAANILQLQDNTTSVMTIANGGAATFRNETDSTAGFLLQSAASGTNDTLFTADTTNNKLVVGNATGTNTATTLLVLDSATADPATGYNGAQYYNTTNNKFRCYQASAWTDCIGSGGSTTLQGAYDNDANSTEAIIALNATDGSLLIRDHSTPLATAFAIQNNAGTTNLLSVASTGVTLGVDTTATSNVYIKGPRPWADVRAYGATGDGSADDTTAIQAAIDAVNTAGGGEVRFPQGTYITTTLTMYSKVHLKGSGIEATILKLKNTTNVDLIKGQNFDTLTGGNTTGGIYNWSITDLTLDGNKANNATSGYGLRVYGYGYVIDNVRIRNTRQDGLYTEWSNSAASPGNDSMEAHISGLKVHDSAASGIVWHGPHDSTMVNVQVYESAAKGIWVKPNGNALVMTGVHSWGVAQTYSFYIEASGVILNGSEGEGASVAQVMIGANDTQIMGGQYFAAGSSGPCIQIGDGTHSNIGGTHIDTKLLNCTGGALEFNSDAGSSKVKALVYQTNNNIITGTPNAFSTQLEINGTGVASVAGNGTSGGTAYQFIGGAGGTTTGTTGQTGGTGATVLLQGGNGGSAPSGSTNGNGGNLTLQGGIPGGGAGTAGSYGHLLLQATGGNVGIGTASPTQKLHVAGNILATGSNFSFGNAATIDALRVVNVNGTVSAGVASDYTHGVLSLVTRANSGVGGRHHALFGRADIGTSITVDQTVGLGIASPVKGGGSTINDNFGILVDPQSAGAVNNYGLYVSGASGGSTLNAGLRVTGVSAAATNYGLYVDAAAQNYLAGKLGLGDTAPDAKLSFGTLSGSAAVHLYEGGTGNNTGLGIQANELQTFIPAAAHISFNAGGDLQASGTNELVRIQGDGKVGIGITGPGAKLHVNEGDIWLTRATDPRFVVGEGTGAGQYGELFWNSANNYLSLNTQSSTQNLALQQFGGNVGIGTTAPDSSLHISKTGAVELRLTSDASWPLILKQTNANIFSITNGGAERLTMDVNGATTFKGANGTNAFQIQNASSEALLNIDTTNRIVVNNGTTAAGNELQNPGFESNCNGWDAACSSTTTNARSGNRAATQSAVADSLALKYVRVEPGQQLYYEGYVRTGSAGSGTGGFYIECRDKDYLNPSFSTGDVWTAPGTTYVLRSNTYTVPAGKSYCHMATTTRTGNTDTWYFDDLYLKRVTEQAPASFQNSVDSTTAFQVQNAASDILFAADTTNNRLKVGNSTGTGTATTLLVLDSGVSGTPPTGVKGAMYYDTTNDKFQCFKGAGAGAWGDCDTTAAGGGTMTLKFMPEFAGGVPTADGADNSGTLISDFQNGLSGGEGEKHNYYQWSTAQTGSQDYDIVVNVPIPSDSNGSAITNFKFWHRDSDGATTGASTTLSMYDDDETPCFTAAVFEGATANVWEQETQSSFGSCAFTANQVITVIFHVKTTSGAGAIRLGEFEFQYSK
ncbi:MAG: glycosyl hydrolase family 28-related protein [Patescibacteria group bacterium]